MNATTTNQTITINSKEGKAFLRKVARSRHEWREQWTLSAFAVDGWRIKFGRHVKGAIGEPDSYVTVETDAVVRKDGNWGLQPATDEASEVFVPEATRVWLHGSEARTAAKFLADGWRFSVEHSSGSVSATRHGLAFQYLQAEKHGEKASDNWDSIQIGCTTTFVKGTIVCRGASE